MFELGSGDTDYIKDMSQQFELFFGKLPQDNERKMMRSLVGTVELMKEHLSPDQQQIAVSEFIKLCFGKAGQMIDANDPQADFKTKMVGTRQKIYTPPIKNPLLETIRQNFVTKLKNDLKTKRHSLKK